MAGCEAAPSQFKLELCDSFSFTVKVNDLTPGTYKVLVTDPSPLDCDSGGSNELTLTVHAPPEVDSVVPSVVCSGGSMLAITGKNLYPGASAELRCGTAPPLVATSVVVQADNQHATVTFGPGAVPGADCDFVFINQDSCEDRPLPHKKVTGTDGPILFNVDPNYVYSDMDTSVKLYVTAITMKTAGAVPTVKMWLHGADPATAVTLTAQFAPNKTNVLQATIPKGTAVGSYDMQVVDDSGCMATMPNAVNVTNTLVVTSGSVEPPYGHSTETVPITITLASDPGAQGAPRAFLTPTTGPGIQLLGVTVTSPTTMTAVVPANIAAGPYEVVIVWPDGKVAVINAPVTDGGTAPVAYTAVANAPPVITNVNPQSLVINQTNQPFEVDGTGFSVDATVELRCGANGATVLNATVTTPPTASCTTCTLNATVSVPGTLLVGDVCLVRVTNGDGSYGEFSALGLTNSSFNLALPKPGTSLITARRALVSAAVKSTSASRFVYAIGGDSSVQADSSVVVSSLSSVEFAPVSVFGAMSAWVASPTSLGTARAFAGTATIGRYVYVFGGNNGSGALNTGERAIVLSPEEAPVITDLDLCLAGGTLACFGDSTLTGPGLDPGVYSYRVSANIDPADPQNCGGETLASDPMILRLSNISISGRKVDVKVTWDKPRDSLGQPLSGITGYNIYRTLKDGVPGTDEVLLATVTGADTLTFNDDGSKTPGTAKPRQLGSTSAWQATPNMAANREGPGGAAAADPADPTKWYVYSLLGRSDASTGVLSYEYLPVTILANGHQTIAASWTTGAQTPAAGSDRWQIGAWSVDHLVASLVTSPDTYVYVGQGKTPAGGFSTAVNRTEVGKVLAGGDLDGLATVNALTNYSGYGVAQAAGQLFLFGGSQGVPSQAASSVKIINPPPTLAPNFDAQSQMGTARYLLGSSIQSAFVFLVGGQDTATTITASTETYVW